MIFESLGNLQNIETKNKIKINHEEIKSGINFFENFIIYKYKDLIKVYDRICNHNGGKIISNNNETICPIHGWKFNPQTGFYNNGIKKKEKNIEIQKNFIEIEISDYKPEIYKFKIKNTKTNIRFFNHAFLKVYADNFSFATDPWAIGPAFNTGWWLKYPTKKDWLDELNKSNFIYISHNHPDHLHPLTLSNINKNIPIVVPNFLNNSAGKYMSEIGFKNIINLDFNKQYNLKKSNLVICLLKSGDFREDSGIYFSNGDFSALLSVDSNSINFERYPNVDFYGSSFAGGASGYPLMFDNYNLTQKIKIKNKDNNFIKFKKIKDLKKIKPKYFMPYAGFFVEKLNRDSFVKKNNFKNSIKEYYHYCKKNDVKLLNVIKKDLYEFKGSELVSSKNFNEKKTIDLNPRVYLKYYKDQFKKIDIGYLKNYFINSEFKDNLSLYISLTNDNFVTLGNNYFIDFSKSKIVFKEFTFLNRPIVETNKKLYLKIRKESFLNTIYNKLPWEDLSIGFQCKISRSPNIYNVKFWNHFTNIYTSSKNVRSITDCGSCISLSHFFYDEICKIKSFKT
jgi:CMP-N-acetylneuraminate monooxygenase